MNNPSVTSKLSRRRFLATTGAAVLLPTVLPGCALGRGSKPAASNRITLGVVGWGMQGPGNTRQFLALDDCQVVAACDLDKNHLNNAVETINSHYGNKDCKAYSDYRELLLSLIHISEPTRPY